MASGDAGAGPAPLDVGCVLRAVRAGVSADELGRVIASYASGGDGASSLRVREARRAAAVDFVGESAERGGGGGGGRSAAMAAINFAAYYGAAAAPGVTPLRAAHDAGRGDLVGVLLEAGADACAAFRPGINALALAIFHGLADTVRALLRSGRHRVDERLPYRYFSCIEAPTDIVNYWCFPVHVAVLSVSTSLVEPGGDPRPLPPRLHVLEVLVREFGADVNARSNYNETPLIWAARGTLYQGDAERAIRALMALGADPDVRCGTAMVLSRAAISAPELVPLLLSLGASANVESQFHETPLLTACLTNKPAMSSTVPLLLRASSRETRRAFHVIFRCSALDLLLRNADTSQRWCREAIDTLLLSGAPVHADNADLALARAARLGASLPPRAAAHEREAWRTHEATVGLAFDLEEQRALDEGVRRREARVAELERLLEEKGIESSSSSSSGDDDDEEEASGGGDGAAGASCEGGGGAA